MEKVRLAVIGLGMIGKLHAETLRKIEELEFVAVADVDEKHRQTAETLGVPYYRSYEEMIAKEKIDGVVAAVPNDLHLPVGKTCAEKGLHLLVEKPIAGTLAEADALCAAAKKNGVHLMIGHHRRHNPHINALRETVRGGGIGKLIGVNAIWAILKPKNYFTGPFSWRTKKGAGPMLINVIHEIDNLRYICGEITRLYAEVSHGARKFEVADSIAVSLRLENDAMATIFFTDSAPGNVAYETNTGENLFFYHSQKTCYHYFGTEGTIDFPQLRKTFYRDEAKAGWQFPLDETGLKIDREDPYERQLKHFGRVIQGKELPICSGEDARKTLQVTLAIEQSSETGKAVVF
jgi:predicted dehydrogenase